MENNIGYHATEEDIQKINQLGSVEVASLEAVPKHEQAGTARTLTRKRGKARNHKLRPHVN
jgi:hypothetical protein